VEGEFADVPDPFPLLLEKAVFAMGGEEDEEALVAEVMNVCETGELPPSPCLAGNGNPVFLLEFLVHGPRVLASGHPPADVEPVAVRQVAAGQLLHEPLDRCCFTAVVHTE